MQKLTAALAGLLMLAVAGCTPSIHPIYREQDVVFEPALVGTFGQKDDADRWRFERAENNRYTLVHTDKHGREGRFIATLARVRGEHFLDLLPAEEQPRVDMNPTLAAHLVRAHIFFHVKQAAPTLQMRLMDPRWLEKYLAGHPKELAHERTTDDRIVITAPTPDLQLFHTRHLGTDGAYGAFFTLERQADSNKKTD